MLVVGASAIASPRAVKAQRANVAVTTASLESAVARGVAWYEEGSSWSTAASPARAESGRSGWPTNVCSVTYWTTNRDASARLVNEVSAPDNRPVVVIVMTGRFTVPTTAPPPAEGAAPRSRFATGTTEIVVTDARTGAILDFKLSDDPPPNGIPTTPQFQR